MNIFNILLQTVRKTFNQDNKYEVYNNVKDALSIFSSFAYFILANSTVHFLFFFLHGTTVTIICKIQGLLCEHHIIHFHNFDTSNLADLVKK